MSDPLRFLLFAGLALALATLLVIGWLRGFARLYPELWVRRAVRRGLIGALSIWGGLMALQPLWRWLSLPRPLRLTILTGTGLGLVLLLLTLPFLWLGAVTRRRAGSAPIEPSDDAGRLTRRALVVNGARMAPMAGVVLGGKGAQGGQDAVQVVELELAYPDLPPQLEGLRILQYSDVHLGQFIDLEEVEQLVERGRLAQADLVVLTGDIADDLALLPEALRRFESLAPRLGVYASIGNHEYFRGLEETRRCYDRSHVPLLLEAGHTLNVDGARLHLAGADDPRYLGRQNLDFFERTVGAALDGAPSDAFHLLMSHRPEGFVAAQKAGVQLTLSGHTHGAQLGVGGRSLLEPLLPEKYLWGAYQAEGARLYTSSGAGHWFPFRLGCPRELPVLKLVRGPATQVPGKRRLGPNRVS